MPKTSKPTSLPPDFDRRVLVKGASFLRQLSTKAIRTKIPLGSIIVLQEGDERLAVILRFEDYEILKKAAAL